MPVILDVPQDPTDIVLQGEQFRAPVNAYRWEATWSPLINDPPDRLPLMPSTLIAGMQNMTMLDLPSMPTDPRTADQSVNNGIRANACVCTPCGAVIPILLGHQWFWNDIGQTTATFTLVGVSRDSTGATLGECRVIVMEVGRQRIDGAPIVAETVSDGSGNYSVVVPMNTAYQVLAYKAGAPDVFGTTVNTLTPT